MNTEIAEKWINALESGEFEQGKELLRSIDNRFCCLGVLCHLYDPNQWFKSDSKPDRYAYGDRRAEHTLPDAVMTWAGIGNPNGRIAHRFSLDQLNDMGKSFSEIAAVIKKYVERL